MDTSRIRQILKRYLSGKASAKEEDMVENWYTSFDKDSLDKEDKILVKDKYEEIGNEIWEGIEPSISGQQSYTAIFSSWLKIAASILIVSAVAFWLINDRLISVSNNYAYEDLSSGVGKRKVLEMPDGSRITLNSGSRIRIGKNFSKERKVEIVDGEVFFEVKHDRSRPFIISSGKMTTCVLGTSFNISAYSALSTMSVQVTSGKVSVSREGQIRVVERDQQCIYDKEGHSLKVQSFNAEQLGWRKGKLSLNDVTFADMAVLMEKNFGVKIRAGSEGIKKNRYTTELSTGMRPEKAVDVLAAIHNLKIKVRGSEYLLFK